MRRGRAVSGVRPRGRSDRPERRAWLPPLGSLHAFEGVGRLRSIKLAAAELCVTPSAVSRQIKQLEEQLGVTLFLREPSGLSLTAAGTAYLREVQVAFAALERGTASTRAVGGTALVRVACVQTLAANWIIPHLGELLASHPEVEIQLVTGDGLADIARGEVDLAIRFGQGSWPGVASEPLVDLDLFPVAAPRLAAKLRTPEDLVAERWLHLTLYPRAFRDWLAAAGLPDISSTRNLSFDAGDLVFRAAATGLGVAMASTVLVRPYLEDRSLVRLFEVDAPVAGQYHLLSREGDERVAPIQAVRTFLRRLARRSRA